MTDPSEGTFPPKGKFQLADVKLDGPELDMPIVSLARAPRLHLEVKLDLLRPGAWEGPRPTRLTEAQGRTLAEQWDAVFRAAAREKSFPGKGQVLLGLETISLGDLVPGTGQTPPVILAWIQSHDAEDLRPALTSASPTAETQKLFEDLEALWAEQLAEGAADDEDGQGKEILDGLLDVLKESLGAALKDAGVEGWVKDNVKAWAKDNATELALAGAVPLLAAIGLSGGGGSAEAVKKGVELALPGLSPPEAAEDYKALPLFGLEGFFPSLQNLRYYAYFGEAAGKAGDTLAFAPVFGVAYELPTDPGVFQGWRVAAEVRADVTVPIDDGGNFDLNAVTAKDASLLKFIGEF